MEKIWIRHFRISTARSLSVILAIFYLGAMGQSLNAADEVKTVIVDVEMPINAGNLAEAKSAAEKKAFENAIDQVLPTTLSPKERSRRLRTAAQWIKTFRVEQEQEEANILKVRYRVEVIVAEESPPPAPAKPPETPLPSSSTPGVLEAPVAPVAPSTPQVVVPLTFFEVLWRPLEVQINPIEFFKTLESQVGLKASSIRFNRGSLLFAVATSASDITQVQIQKLLDSRVQVRTVVDPSSALVTPEERSAMPPPATITGGGSDISPNTPMGPNLAPIPNDSPAPTYQEPTAP